MDEDDPTTSETLLREVGQNAASARSDEFARLYAPLLVRFVGRERFNNRPISPDLRDDLVQEAYIAILKALPNFQYNPEKGRFRGYLSRIVHRVVMHRCIAEDAHQRNRVDICLPDGAVREFPSPMSSEQALLEDADERLLMGRVWTLALDRVFSKNLFAPNTKAVFRRYVIEDTSAEAVAREFKMTPNAVYQIKDRVLKAVSRELASLPSIPGMQGLEGMLESLMRDASGVK